MSFFFFFSLILYLHCSSDLRRFERGDTSCCTKCNTSSLDRDHGRQGSYSSILPYRLRCVNNKFSCDLLFSCLTPIQVDAITSLQLMEPSASMSDIRSPRICMPCTLMCRLRIDSTRTVKLGLARAWITSIVGIIRRRTRVCIAFSFLATELTFFLVMDPGMGSSGCTTSCF